MIAIELIIDSVLALAAISGVVIAYRAERTWEQKSRDELRTRQAGIACDLLEVAFRLENLMKHPVAIDGFGDEIVKSDDIPKAKRLSEELRDAQNTLLDMTPRVKAHLNPFLGEHILALMDQSNIKAKAVLDVLSCFTPDHPEGSKEHYMFDATMEQFAIERCEVANSEYPARRVSYLVKRCLKDFATYIPGAPTDWVQYPKFKFEEKS